MARRLIAVAVGVMACGGGGNHPPAPEPSRPLPISALLGVAVSVYPLTMVVAEESLGWSELLQPRETALRTADSVISAALLERVPEITWVMAPELRAAAARSPAMLTNPDRMATAVLRRGLRRIPDPLRSQMRSLTAVTGDRWALVPASLLFFPDSAGGARAELTAVLADVRLGDINWRTVARGRGDTPWSALADALSSLTPGLP